MRFRGLKSASAQRRTLKDHVLGRFSKADLETIRSTSERAVAAIALIVQGKTDEAMNKYNG